MLAALFLSVVISEKVQVTQFVMAKCPMSTSLHLDFARKVMSHPDLRYLNKVVASHSFSRTAQTSAGNRCHTAMSPRPYADPSIAILLFPL